MFAGGCVGRLLGTGSHSLGTRRGGAWSSRFHHVVETKTRSALARTIAAIARVTAPSTLWRHGSFKPQGKHTSWKNIHTSSRRRLASHSAKGTFIAR